MSDQDKTTLTYVVERRPDTATTGANSGWVRDNHGQWWRLTEHLPAKGTGDRHGVIDAKGIIRER